MLGKEKCRMLRRIRKEIAEANDITYITEECTFKGACSGTCPKCEADLKYLEREIEKRRALGRRVALAGISIGTMAALTACTPTDVISAIQNAAPAATPDDTIEQLAGEVCAPEPLDGDIEVLEGEVPAETELPEAPVDVVGIVPADEIAEEASEPLTTGMPTPSPTPTPTPTPMIPMGTATPAPSPEPKLPLTRIF